MKRFLVLALLLVTESAIAAPLPLDPHRCYIQYSDGRTINLDYLCGQTETTSLSSAPTSTTVAPSSSSGKCTFSSDRDSRGHLCGGRASARRRGGK